MNGLKFFVHWGFLVVQLVTAVLAWRSFFKNKSWVWRIFTSIWVLTFFVELTGKVMGAFGIRNFGLYSLFDVLFYPTIVVLYVLVYGGTRLILIALIASVGLALWSAVHLLQNGLREYNTYYATVAGSIILFLALTYLVFLFLDKETSSPLRQDAFYWLSVGFIIYFSFSTVLLGMYNSLVQSKVSWLPDFIFYANHFITLVLHVFLWIGFTAYNRWTK